MRQYPIRLKEIGDRLQGAEDFAAFFRVGYSAAENALYVAVEVDDDSVLEETEETAWWTHDRCEIYVETGHEAGHVAVGSYLLPRPRLEEGVQGAVQRGRKAHFYEWRLDVGP